LGALIGGELWRGRDNLAVSLRPPLDWRTLASAVTPLLWTAASLTAVTAFATGRPRLALASVLIPTLMVVARAARICKNRRSWTPLSVAQSLAVAACYEIGRALGAVLRAGHRFRRAHPAKASSQA
jgi:hypothetical protein